MRNYIRKIVLAGFCGRPERRSPPLGCASAPVRTAGTWHWACCCRCR